MAPATLIASAVGLLLVAAVAFTAAAGQGQHGVAFSIGLAASLAALLLGSGGLALRWLVRRMDDRAAALAAVLTRDRDTIAASWQAGYEARGQDTGNVRSIDRS